MLSTRLDAGDHMVSRVENSIGPWTEQMKESIGANSAAQRDAAEKTTDNVEKLATTGTRFLEDFHTTPGGSTMTTARKILPQTKSTSLGVTVTLGLYCSFI